MLAALPQKRFHFSSCLLLVGEIASLVSETEGKRAIPHARSHINPYDRRSAVILLKVHAMRFDTSPCQ